MARAMASRGGEAGAVIGDAGAEHFAVGAERDVVFGARRKDGIEMGGEKDERPLRGGSEGDEDVAGAVDAGVPAERAALGGEPVGALLFEKSWRGDAAELEVNVVDPLFFARKPLERLADAGTPGDFAGGRRRGNGIRRHRISLAAMKRRREGVASSENPWKRRGEAGRGHK